MKKLTVAMVILMLSFSGCEYLLPKYDITVVNDAPSENEYIIYIDNNKQFHLTSGQSNVIHDVSSGKHLIECGYKFTVGNTVMIVSYSELDVQSDTTWSVMGNYSLGEWYSKE